MTTNGVVITRADDATPAIGGLFQGKSFLITMRVPMRNHFVDVVKANGGRVVRIEIQADYIIADHARRDCPPTSLSYTFIEAATRNGALPDPNDHRAGPAPGVVRQVGSTTVAPKGTRTPFTAQDDRELWEWVQQCVAGGAAVKGLEIYKQLEAVNPRHTTQSWRDRYLKKLAINPPHGVNPPAARAVPTPTPQLQTNTRDASRWRPAAGRLSNGRKRTIAARGQDVDTGRDVAGALEGAAEGSLEPDAVQEEVEVENEEEEAAEEEQEEEEEQEVEEDGDVDLDEADKPRNLRTDFNLLMENIDDIQVVAKDAYEDMWEQLSASESHRTAEQWKRLYEDKVLPAYEAKRREERRLKGTPSKPKARLETPEPPELSEELSTPELVALKAKAAREAPEREQAASPSTQKRKRQTPTPKASSSQTRKRMKADHKEDRAGESPLDRPAKHDRVAPSTARSAERVDAARKLQDDVEMADDSEPQADADELSLPDEDALIISEANRAAKAQLQAEAVEPDVELPVDDSVAIERGQPEPSNAEGIYDQDIPSDVQEGTPKQSERSVRSSDAVEQIFQGDQQPLDAVDEQLEPKDTNEVSPSGGLKLTESNLASQQAGQKRQNLRGADLPEDGENENQEQYAEYLEKLMGASRKKLQAHHDAATAAVEVPDRLMDTPEEEGLDAIELRSDPDLDPQAEQEPESQFVQGSKPEGTNARKEGDGDATLTTNENLPVSRAQEMRQSLQSMLDPEASASGTAPPKAGRAPEPQLPNEDQPFSSQIALEARNGEPYEQEDESVLPGSDTNQMHGYDTTEARRKQNGQAGQDKANVNEKGEEMEIDLSLAEPGGGFQFSSQSESQAQQLLHQYRWEQGQEPGLQQQKQAKKNQQQSENRIEISSDSASSDGSDEELEEVPAKALTPKAQVLDTQDILDAGSQRPDLSFPLPPDSEDASSEPELPSDPVPKATPKQPVASRQRRATSAPRPKPAPQPKQPQSETIQSFLTRLTAKGFSQASLQSALYRTSAQFQAAEMLAMAEKFGFPLDGGIPAIWTAEDDAKVGSTDATVLRELLDRKGWEEYEARARFLEEWRAGQ